MKKKIEQHVKKDGSVQENLYGKNLSEEQLEQIMKEKFKLSVHIDSKFKEKLRVDVREFAVNKFLHNDQMSKAHINKMDSDVQMKSKSVFLQKVKVLFTQQKFLAVMVVFLVIAVTAITLLVTGVASLPGKKDSNILSGSQFAEMYVNSGSATILRNGEKLTEEKQAKLEVGDVVQASENSMVDIKMNYGRLALDNNAQVAFTGSVNDVETKIENGTVFLSTALNYSDKVVVDTLTGATVSVQNGSALITQTGDEKEVIGTSMRENLFEKASSSLVSKAWAVATEGNTNTEGNENTVETETTIAAVAGDVVVKQGDVGVKIEIGKEVTVKKETMEEVKETKREVFQTTFFKTVKEKEQSEGKDLGTAKDLEAPTVTIISPEDGIEVKKDSIVVKFKSSEDGWLINETPWREIVADKEVSYEVKGLKVGKNTIQLKVKDKSYNRTVKELVVNYKKPEAKVNIVWNKLEARTNGVYLEWTADGVEKGTHKYKVFRDGSYKTAIEIVGTNVYWVDENTTKGQTYKYKVAVYKGSDKVAITDEKSVKAETETSGGSGGGSSCTVKLWKTTSAALPNTSLLFKSYAVVQSNDVAWSVSGDCPDYQGYKLVWNDTGSPTYPDNMNGYQYYSAGTTEGNVNGGTWYVRVGLYKNGECSVYSNQLHSTFN